MTVEMKPVVSSNIESVGHDGDTLFVKFKSGPTWKYHAVNAQTHAELMRAESTGSYFAKFIKPAFHGEKVSDGAKA